MTTDKEWTFVDDGTKVGMSSVEIRVGVSQYDRVPRVLIVSYESQVRHFTDGDADHKVSSTTNVEEVLRTSPPPGIVVLDRRILDQGCAGTPQCVVEDTAATSADTGVDFIARLLKVLGTASREAKHNEPRE